MAFGLGRSSAAVPRRATPSPPGKTVPRLPNTWLCCERAKPDRQYEPLFEPPDRRTRRLMGGPAARALQPPGVLGRRSEWGSAADPSRGAWMGAFGLARGQLTRCSAAVEAPGPCVARVRGQRGPRSRKPILPQDQSRKRDLPGGQREQSCSGSAPSPEAAVPTELGPSSGRWPLQREPASAPRPESTVPLPVRSAAGSETACPRQRALPAAPGSLAPRRARTAEGRCSRTEHPARRRSRGACRGPRRRPRTALGPRLADWVARRLRIGPGGRPAVPVGRGSTQLYALERERGRFGASSSCSPARRSAGSASSRQSRRPRTRERRVVAP